MSSTGETNDPLPLHVWQFTPVARADDPTWQGRTMWEDFRIVAPTSGVALLLAARYDEQSKNLSVADSQDGQQLRSGLEDPRLYRIDQIGEADASESPTGTVIRASRTMPPKRDGRSDYGAPSHGRP